MIDFEVLEVGVADDLRHGPSGRPVYRAIVRSYRDQSVHVLDTRHGSWNTPPDDEGRFRNAPPVLAATLQDEVHAIEGAGGRSVRRMADTGAVNNPFIVGAKKNPFMVAA